MAEAPAPTARTDHSALARILTDGAASAGAVLALSIALVGFRIIDVPGGIDIVLRMGDVVAATLAAFIGRIAILLLRRGTLMVPVLIGCLSIAAWLIAGLTITPLRPMLPFKALPVDALLALIALVLAGRAGWGLSRSGVIPVPIDAFERQHLADRARRIIALIGPVLLFVALVLPFLPIADRRLIDIGILVLTYIMLGWGLNIVVGLAGLLDLGYVAFYAVGAYSYALLATYFGLGFWTCLPFAGLMAASAGVLLGFPVLRLRGDYLAIVTLGFGEMVRVVLVNWYSLTNGPDGISGIPRPTFLGLPFTANPPEGTVSFHQFFELEYASVDRIIFLYYLILALALLTNLFTLRIRRLPIGRAWEALREDEIACRALGINPTNTKLTAFAIGAMFGGFAGAFFATRQGFISPESFTFIESAIILAIVVLGGMGSQIGVVLAAILLIGLPEFFRELQGFRMLAFGGAMVLITVWRPSGLLVHRAPTINRSGTIKTEAAK